MLKRILFLDDNQARRKWAERELPWGDGELHRIANVDTATTAQDAVFHLRLAGQAYDSVYLDHDLGDETYADSSRPDTGMEVVRWIVANRPTIGRIIVHSMNNPAACNMVAALEAAGYSASYVPFLALAKSRMECEP